jgi:hypothetical protein
MQGLWVWLFRGGTGRRYGLKRPLLEPDTTGWGEAFAGCHGDTELGSSGNPGYLAPRPKTTAGSVATSI